MNIFTMTNLALPFAVPSAVYLVARVIYLLWDLFRFYGALMFSYWLQPVEEYITVAFFVARSYAWLPQW